MPPMDRTVLVVDDDHAFRRLAAGMLGDAGYTVVAEAETVAGALAEAERARPDAALVDIGLPDGDGFGLTERLVALPWAPRVAIISSDADAANGPAALQAGAVGFLPKDQLSASGLRELLG